MAPGQGCPSDHTTATTPTETHTMIKSRERKPAPSTIEAAAAEVLTKLRVMPGAQTLETVTQALAPFRDERRPPGEGLLLLLRSTTPKQPSFMAVVPFDALTLGAWREFAGVLGLASPEAVLKSAAGMLVTCAAKPDLVQAADVDAPLVASVLVAALLGSGTVATAEAFYALMDAPGEGTPLVVAGTARGETPWAFGPLLWAPVTPPTSNLS